MLNQTNFPIFSGISSLVFTRDAEALYLHSSSELQRLSLSATRVTSARCYLPLPEGARDQPEEEEANITAGDEQQNEEASNTAASGLLVNGTAESKESSVNDKVCCRPLRFYLVITIEVQPIVLNL